MRLGVRDPSRRSTAGVILAVAALALSALTVRAPDAAAGPPAAAEEDWVETTLASMTLEEKVGQLFMTNVYGSTADTQAPADVAANRALYGVDNAEQVIDKYHPGGIIYFAWTNSVQNPPQIAGLSNGIQDAALSQRVPVPSLVGIDQEGGIVARIGPPATQLPGNMALGAGRSTADAQTAAAITGDELRGDGHQLELRPRRRRQRQPGQPGHRRPLVRREPAAGRRPHRRPDPRLHRRRRGRCGQALPRPRRHRR